MAAFWPPLIAAVIVFGTVAFLAIRNTFRTATQQEQS